MKYIIIVLSIVILNLSAYAQDVGDPAPNFTLNSTDGTPFTLSDQEGKVVFIFLFGNTCPTCVANAPNIETNVQQVYGERDDFIAIGIDVWNGNTAIVNSFGITTGLTFDLLQFGSAVQASYTTTYDRILIIDTLGVIRYKGTSNANSISVTAAKAVIDQYLRPSNNVNGLNFGEDIKIGPNPTNNTLNITAPTGSYFEIYNIIGERVLSYTNKSIDSQIDVSHLFPGLYLIKHKEETFKIIIQ